MFHSLGFSIKGDQHFCFAASNSDGKEKRITLDMCQDHRIDLLKLKFMFTSILEILLGFSKEIPLQLVIFAILVDSSAARNPQLLSLDQCTLLLEQHLLVLLALEQRQFQFKISICFCCISGILWFWHIFDALFGCCCGQLKEKPQICALDSHVKVNVCQCYLQVMANG